MKKLTCHCGEIEAAINIDKLEKILRCKLKYDKLALREPRNGQQVYDRIVWERLRKILIQRYDRFD